MGELSLIINGQEVRVPSGTTILEAALSAGIYIPALCNHPDLPPAEGLPSAGAVYQGGRRIENKRPHQPARGCGLCIVEVEGRDEPVASCSTPVVEGMVVKTESERVRKKRQDNLIPILTGHPHACLTCAQQDGCSRVQCSANVPENERCCHRFGRCELQDVTRYVGIPEATPRWVPTDLPVIQDAPLFEWDFNLCIGCTRCVRACRDLRGVEAIGFVWDEQGWARVGTLAPSLSESGCRFCAACVEVCPTGALSDKGIRTSGREQDLVPCKSACPAGIDVPEYIRLIAQGRPDEAYSVILETVPFPGVLGRVCPSPCEDVCRRGEVNEPVAVCALKRYAADRRNGISRESIRAGADTVKRAAVIGAGPAGLTVAFWLRRAGHRVTLFEAGDLAGGMMRYGIPPYRLPRDVLDREIQAVFDLGVDFRPGAALGRDFKLEDLWGEGYDALFIGVGAQKSRKAGVKGEELHGVFQGLEFLRMAAQGRPPEVKKRVVVIGGGNTAVDAALTALRLGAEHVTMACLEGREELPAHERDVERLLAEGVRLVTSRGLSCILGKEGRVRGVELTRCLEVFDAGGSFNPVLDPQAGEIVEADQVILAVGQAVDLSFLDDESGIQTEKGTIVVDRQTQETGMPNVYAGGDATGVQGSVIHAVSAGRRAAAAMDLALGGSGFLDKVLEPRPAPDPRLGRDEGFAERPREPVPEMDPSRPSGYFDEVVLGYDPDAALREASRCLQCDSRLYIGSNPAPPRKWLPFTRECVEQVPASEGVYRLMDENRKVLVLKGTPDLKAALLRELEENQRAAMFDFEENKMYSRRETELIQKHLREYGEMPGGMDDDLDDLF